MNNRDKLSELEKAIPFDEFFLNFRRAAYRVYCRNAKMKNQDKFKNILKEEYMIRDSVKRLMCEEDRLKELMAIPMTEILSCRDKADTVAPEEALRYLADMFIDNYGESLRMCSFAYDCASYWISELNFIPELNDKYGRATTLADFLPILSDKYHEGLFDKYDSCVITDKELVDILVEELNSVTNEKEKIILCAGIYNALTSDIGARWLGAYSMEKIEEGIVNLKNRELIEYRCHRSLRKYFRFRFNRTKENQLSLDTGADRFTDDEIKHFISLNDRLVELQHEVMDQVKVITGNLREQIAKGFHQYDTFVIDGYIYVEAYEEDNTDELLDALSSFAKYSVICSNDNTTQEHLEAEITEDVHWYANWGGIFHQLEESHGLKFCRTFRYLFEESRVFTIGDIMKIKSEMLLPHVEINI